MSRGKLRVYLGAAPGVGKTYAMLAEGHRRADRGTDVVLAFVECHGRRLTEELVEGLEQVPPRSLVDRGGTFREMDVDAVLRRRPRVALVDEVAHTNLPGSRNAKRWQDVEELLDAGLDVVTTVNVQHLESLNDVVQRITGVRQTETVPDAVVRAAEQVELVDMEPEALRRRMAHGNVYAPDEVDAALGSYFRLGNLTALRELALLWTADKVDDALQRYRAEHHIAATWEARERVVVALTGGPEGRTLVRRAARIASRSTGGDLLAVHVSRSGGLTRASPGELAAQRSLVESLGGSYHQVLGEDVAGALLTFARAENATQLVLGASRRSRLAALLTEGVGARTTRDSGDIDVHIVTHEESRPGRWPPPLRGSLSGRRRAEGLLLAGLLLPLLTAALTTSGRGLNLVNDVLLFLLVVVVVALVGGALPALAAAVAASLLLNFFFTPPLHTLAIAEGNNALALLAFVGVAALVGSVVGLASRRTREAARSAAESETLATLAGTVLRGETALPALVDRVREAFGQVTVTLLERVRKGRSPQPAQGPVAEWTVVASAGAQPLMRPEAADTVATGGEDVVLALRGRALFASDERLLAAFAAQAGALLEHARLTEAAAAAAPLAEANKMRTALLAAVGHDLRSPLATAKAVVTSLLGRDVDWSAEDRRDLLETADSALDRLAALVDNLLDMSRLHAGALAVRTRATAVDEVVALALDGLGDTGHRVLVDLPDHLPEVLADPGLLERSVANLLANAVRYSPPEVTPLLTGSTLGNRVEIRVIDRGKGIPREQWDHVFLPFQRLGDTDNTTGVGLGLALARGLVEVMGGTLTPEDTPGGGLTMVVSLPAASVPDGASTAPQPGRRERATGSGQGP